MASEDPTQERPTIYLRVYRPDSMQPYEICTNEAGEDILEGIGMGRVSILPNSCDDNLTVVLAKKSLKLEAILGSIAEDRQDITQKVYDYAVQFARRQAESMPDPFEFVNEVKEPVKIKLRSL